MGLETGTTLSALVSSNPIPGDPTSEGDDHLRLIKSVLKSQFPGSGGTGFSVPIVANETEINHLTGLTENVQAKLNTILPAPFPAGTTLIFFNAAAPAGWTQVTTHSDKMLRIVSGTGGGSGGSDSPILNDKVPVHTHPASSSIVDPGHSHTYLQATSSGNQKPLSSGTAPFDSYSSVSTGTALTNISVSTTVSGNTGSNWTPKYIDVIMATKA